MSQYVHVQKHIKDYLVTIVLLSYFKAEARRNTPPLLTSFDNSGYCLLKKKKYGILYQKVFHQSNNICGSDEL